MSTEETGQSAPVQPVVSGFDDFEVVYINDGEKIVQSFNGQVHAPMSLDAVAIQLNRTANQHNIVEAAKAVIAMWDGPKYRLEMKPCIDRLRAVLDKMVMEMEASE